jgi:ATP-binding cassette, subfamily B, bacterial
MMSRERRLVKAANYRGRWYWVGTAGWIAYFVAPIAPGWLVGQIFDELQQDETTTRLWVLFALLGVAETLMIWGLAAAHWVYIQGIESSKALMRANVVRSQLASGGGIAALRNVPIGDVLVRMRDDPFDTMFLLDNWVDLIGALLYGVAAAYFLVRIDPWGAVVGIAPLLLVGWGNLLIASLARKFRQRARVAASAVSGFLAAAFEASLTVKVAGAQPGVLGRLKQLNDRRAKAAVGDQVWNEVLWTVNSTIADVFVGLALVVAARGQLTAGEIAQFAAYLLGLVWLPMRIGGLITGRRRYDVSMERLDELVAPQRANEVDALTGSIPMPILGGPPVPPLQLGVRRPLERLEVRGLTIENRGIAGLDLSIERGTLTVISGPVGSGKTSLLRGILGLIELDSGEVRWNGEVIVDRAAFFTPPNAAYVAQVPRLFAESLADNLRLGHPISADDVTEAIRLAAFEDDLADLPDGMETLVGARGVRLSGGQAQRAAGARALAHRPELLVLDDLTSALDVETEGVLWDRLAAAGYTVIAASNRPVAIARADQVITLS